MYILPYLLFKIQNSDKYPIFACKDTNKSASKRAKPKFIWILEQAKADSAKPNERK
jgi:hypothetical protein